MSDEINLKGLDQLLKALKAKPPKVRVGVLGKKAGRTSGAETNASIGVRHELGIGVPQRSFLRMPISDNLEKRMEKSGALNRDVLAQVIKLGSITPWMRKIATLAETIVLDAFDTGGFGKWSAWKNPAERAKHSNAGMLLVDTTQLRNSITSEVKE